MAEHVPVLTPGQSDTRTAAVAVTGGQLLSIAAAGVSPTAAATAAWYGVAGFDAAAGEEVTVRKGGVQKILAAGAVAAGDIVVPASAGRVATNATPGAGQQVGIAVTGGTDVPVEVDLVR